MPDAYATPNLLPDCRPLIPISSGPCLSQFRVVRPSRGPLDSPYCGGAIPNAVAPEPTNACTMGGVNEPVSPFGIATLHLAVVTGP
jgi:hypothetical protein